MCYVKRITKVNDVQ